MPQAELIEVKEKEKGIKLTFINEFNEKKTGIYNLGKLSSQDLKKMIGCRISFRDEEGIEIAKAWTKEGRPAYCDDFFHALDR